MHPSVKQLEGAALESFRSVMDMAKAALNSALLVNGGGAVAMLTFCGAVAPRAKLPVSIIFGSTSFALGVLAGAIAMGVAYLAQHGEHWNNKARSNRSRKVAIGLVGVAYVLFLTGAVLSGVGIYCVSVLASPGLPSN